MGVIAVGSSGFIICSVKEQRDLVTKQLVKFLDNDLKKMADEITKGE
jgi:hypothetical protein